MAVASNGAALDLATRAGFRRSQHFPLVSNVLHRPSIFIVWGHKKGLTWLQGEVKAQLAAARQLLHILERLHLPRLHRRCSHGLCHLLQRTQNKILLPLR